MTNKLNAELLDTVVTFDRMKDDQAVFRGESNNKLITVEVSTGGLHKDTQQTVRMLVSNAVGESIMIMVGSTLEYIQL